MTRAEYASTAAEVVAAHVAARLERQGAACELRQLAGFSASETDLLVRLEREARG